MLKVGLTGGIASGKTLVAEEFARLGVPVVDADRISRELTATGQLGFEALVRGLGPAILDPKGNLDRQRLRQRLFTDTALRRQVEGLLHPLVLKALQAKLMALRSPYALAVIPLLVEVPASRKLVDRVLLVDCSPEQQLSRLMSRDHETESSARAILAAQAPRPARLEAADDILLNEDEPAALHQNAARLHAYYLELAARGDYHGAGLKLP